MTDKARCKRPAPKKRATKNKTAPEAWRPRLSLEFHTDAPRGPSAVQFAFLNEIAQKSGLTVAEVRRGLAGLRDVLCENLKANKYSRIPGVVCFYGARPKPIRVREVEINGKTQRFKARTAFRLKLRGTAMPPLRQALADLG